MRINSGKNNCRNRYFCVLTALAVCILVALTGSTNPKKDSIYHRKMNEPGVKMILIDGKYRVWTQKVGNSPYKILLLHGGPGYTHEFLESFADQLPQAGIEIYFYEQLGSYFSDQPDDSSLWTLQRYVQEVEQVRLGLGLDRFTLFGYSWGGQLALQYAVQYPQSLDGLIVSNMTYSEEAIKKRIAEITKRILSNNPSLMKENRSGLAYDSIELKEKIDRIFNERYYRIPTIMQNDAFSRAVRHRNQVVFESVLQDLEKIQWNVWDRLPEITTPVLLMTGQEDYASSPDDVKQMCGRISNCMTYISQTGSHLLFHDEPESYFKALIAFVKYRIADPSSRQMNDCLPMH